MAEIKHRMLGKPASGSSSHLKTAARGRSSPIRHVNDRVFAAYNILTPLEVRIEVGTLPFGLTARNSHECCSPLLVSTGIIFVGQPGLFQERRNFAGFGVGWK
jgi:hypothetical protein